LGKSLTNRKNLKFTVRHYSEGLLVASGI